MIRYNCKKNAMTHTNVTTSIVTSVPELSTSGMRITEFESPPPSAHESVTKQMDGVPLTLIT
jgi:hypothetical protein